MKLALLSSSCIFLITCIPLGAYSLTRESIHDKVYGYCILESASPKAWKKAEENFKKESNLQSSVLPFKELHKKIKDQNSSASLKDTCIGLYSRDSSSVFKRENSNLLSLVKKYCSLKIEERLGTENKINDDEIDKRIQELTSHSPEKGELNDDFLKIQKNTQGDKKQDFKSACENLYKKPFMSEKTNDWILVELYCKKK